MLFSTKSAAIGWQRHIFADNFSKKNINLGG